MERAVLTSHDGGKTPIASAGKSERAEREERVLDALSQLRWAEGPIALVATDLDSLEDDGSLETIGSLIELSRALDRDSIMILNLEYLADEGSSVPLTQRINALQWVIRRTAKRMNISTPRFVLEERGPSFDLRVELA